MKNLSLTGRNVQYSFYHEIQLFWYHLPTYRPIWEAYGMLIRRANPQDAASIAKVHVDSWRTTYRGIVPDSYLERLSYGRREAVWKQILSHQTDEGVFVAEVEGHGIVGFSSGGKERSGNSTYHGELYAMYVLKGFQGNGIGRALTNAVVKHLSENGYNSMLVWVLADNPSRGYYEHVGGKKLTDKIEEMNGKHLTETSYGWDDLEIWN